LKVIPGGGRGEERALQRLLGTRHAWLLKLGAFFALAGAGAFLLAPAFSRRAPHLTAEEVAAAVAASEGLGPVVTGLVEVLDLDRAQAAALKRTLERFDAAATAPRQERDAALAVLRGAASGTGAEAAAVDVALAQLREAQARLQQLDAELVEAVSVGLTPSQKARAAIVLGHTHQRGVPTGSAPAAPKAPGPAPEDRPVKTAPAARP